MKTVWIIDEGSPGHLSQSVGLVEAMSAINPLDCVTVSGRSKVRGWLRPLIRQYMGHSGRPLPGFLLPFIANLKIPDNCNTPDLIVSSGGKSVFAARSLACKYKAPYVFIGERKPYPAEWFHTIISPVAQESSENSIDVELIPTPVSPEIIAHKGQAQKNLWCMVIGGASRSHHFQEKDWIQLAEGMNTVAERENIRWLLTTSRRTGSESEKTLQKHLNLDFLVDAIWWSEQPRKEFYSFMARAGILFVTQDSVTMVTEAVSSGKPVVVISPEKTFFSENNFLPDYYQRLEDNNRIMRTNTASLNEMISDQCNGMNVFKESILPTMAKQVWERLGFQR